MSDHAEPLIEPLASPSTQAVLLEMVTARGAQFKLPENLTIVASANPSYPDGDTTLP